MNGGFLQRFYFEAERRIQKNRQSAGFLDNRLLLIALLFQLFCFLHDLRQFHCWR